MADHLISVVHFGDGAASTAEDLGADLRACGLSARVVPAQQSRADPSSFALLVLIALPLHGFLTALGESLGTSTGEALRNVLTKTFARLRRADQPALPDGTTGDRTSGAAGQGLVILRDAVHGIDVELHRDLPPEAFGQLQTLKLSQSAVLRYDRDAGTWTITER
jgi:hypothetical protein